MARRHRFGTMAATAATMTGSHHLTKDIAIAASFVIMILGCAYGAFMQLRSTHVANERPLRMVIEEHEAATPYVEVELEDHIVYASN